jgi:hypothetical protein
MYDANQEEVIKVHTTKSRAEKLEEKNAKSEEKNTKMEITESPKP